MKRIAFVYWGRRGALSQFTLELADAAARRDDLDPTFSLSRNNELFSSFRPFGDRIVPVDTFARSIGAVGSLWRVPRLRAQVAVMAADRRIERVVNLMPHVWSPLVHDAFTAGGARYAAIVHDAQRHPGDHRGLANWWTLRDAARSDMVLTLSRSVQRTLQDTNAFPGRPIVALRHPDLSYGAATGIRALTPARPVRLLFFGRIMPYKGLSLFTDALERLRRDGIPFEAGVCGEGALGAEEGRLRALGVEIVNRWLPTDEIPAILARFDVMVLSHVEASQSGVVALAHGQRMPVVATPVGGMMEQVVDGSSGVLAASVDGPAIAAAIRRLVETPGLYQRITANLASGDARHSMDDFLSELMDALR